MVSDVVKNRPSVLCRHSTHVPLRFPLFRRCVRPPETIENDPSHIQSVILMHKPEVLQ